MRNRKSIPIFIMTLFFAFLVGMLSGCGVGTNEDTRLRDLDFTVVSEERLPEELKQIIDERKKAEFKVTYTDNEYLYICVGYGEQNTGGYSIAVNDLYLTENAICISTSLLGPSTDEAATGAPSYPYIVVKLEYLDKTIEFE